MSGEKQQGEKGKYVQVLDVNGVYVGNGEIIVTGIPPEEEGTADDILKHNCDYMGCSSISHVIFRAKIYEERHGGEEVEIDG